MSDEGEGPSGIHSLTWDSSRRYQRERPAQLLLRKRQTAAPFRRRQGRPWRIRRRGRAHLAEQCESVLGNAQPSLESWYRVRSSRRVPAIGSRRTGSQASCAWPIRGSQPRSRQHRERRKTAASNLPAGSLRAKTSAERNLRATPTPVFRWWELEAERREAGI